MAEQGNARLADLLKQLEAEGAKVKTGDKNGSALTSNAMSSLAAQPDFNAWVSWTKSF